MTAVCVVCRVGLMRRMSVELDEEGVGALAKCMAAMPSHGADGELRAVTISLTVREALRRMAAADERGRK